MFLSALFVSGKLCCTRLISWMQGCALVSGNEWLFCENLEFCENTGQRHFTTEEHVFVRSNILNNFGTRRKEEGMWKDGRPPMFKWCSTAALPLHGNLKPENSLCLSPLTTTCWFTVALLLCSKIRPARTFSFPESLPGTAVLMEASAKLCQLLGVPL